MALAAVLSGILAIPFGADAALTPAGTVIPATASVSFSVSGNSHKVGSNVVTVTVVQLNRLGIDPPKAHVLRPGATLNITHTITNLGNVPDTFNLEVIAPSGFAVHLFAADGITPLNDTNGDGKIDTGAVAVGASVDIVAKLTVPSNASPGITEETIIKAVSAGNPAAAFAITEASKIIKPASWAPLSITVTPQGQVPRGSILTYTNVFGYDGETDATNVVVSNHLDPNLTLIEGSALPPAGINGAIVNYDPATRDISWSIPSLPIGYQGSVSFRVRVEPSTPADTSIANSVRILSDQTRTAQSSEQVSTSVIEQPLLISIVPSTPDAEIGQFVNYTVTVENVSKTLISNQTEVTCSLPKGFRYAKGSSSMDGAPLPDPAGGTTPTWQLGTLQPGTKRQLAYRSLVSVDAPLGNGVDSASATGTSPAGNHLFSPSASATVKVLEGVLNSKAIILGRVFVDLNKDRMPDDNEHGIKGIRLYLEDGSYAMTDGEGKFKLDNVDAGEHVLKIDKSTIPDGYQPVPLDNTFAGDGNSRFISVPYGGMGRGDFGLIMVKKLAVQPEKKEKGQEGRVYVFGTEMTAPPPTLEQQIATMPADPEILVPTRGAVLRKPWTEIVVRVPEGADYALLVNDVPLLQKQVGKTIVERKRKIRVQQFVGVRLETGANRIVLQVTHADGHQEQKETVVTAPGKAAKLVVSPDKAEIPADGKGVIPFTVSFIDEMGNPAIGDIVYTVLAEKAEVLEKDLDPAKPGHQLKAVDGKGSFKLRSPTTVGAEKIVIDAGTDLQGKADLFFTPEHRDWVVVGTGSLKVSNDSVSGKTGDISKGEHFQKGINEDGRFAFFSKGTFLDKYLLTAAYDSKKSGDDKRNKLFQRVEPDRYYPMYGDASARGYEAESQRKFYGKIEKDRSSILFGDFNTNLSPTEFSRYDRSFNGVKADIQTPNTTLRAFGTSTNHSADRDEIPGNGTSGYFFLSKKPIIENTDKIRIEVRDRYHTERVLSSAEKSPYQDYFLDYRTGAILFREPVPSYDGNLNPVRIVVLYESEDQNDENYSFGGRGAIRSDKGSEVGVTGVVEQKGVGSNSLFGIDGIVKVNDQTSVLMEAARSDTIEKGDGLAYKAELATRIQNAMVNAYYRRVGRTFMNPSMTGSEIGTEKYGGKVVYSLLDKTRLIAEGFFQSDSLNSTSLTSTSLGISRLIKSFAFDAGYKFLQGQDDAGQQTTSHMVYAGIGGKLTDRLQGSIMQEQAFDHKTVKDYPSRTLLKLNYKLTEKTSAFLTQEIKESGITPGNNTLMGITSKLSDNLTLSTSYKETTGTDSGRQLGAEAASRWKASDGLSLTSKTGYQIQNSMTGGRGQALLGVGSSWEPRQGLRLGAQAERTQIVTGSNDPAGVNTAVALSAEYLAKEDRKITGRYEFRLAPSETTNLYSLGGAWKLTGSFSLLGKATFWSSAKPTGTDILFDGEIGGAYRPLGRESLYLLGVLRFKDDSKGSLATGEDVKSLISSVELSDRIRSNLTLHGKYAGKYSWDSLYGQQLQSYTDLLLAGATFDVTGRLDLDLSGKISSQYDTGVKSFGLIPEVGYRVYKNIRVAVGYNFSRLNDRDLSGEGYSANGPFLQMKFKFDEETIKDVSGAFREWSAGKAAAKASTLQPPAPKPAMVTLKAALVEEPVNLFGSVEKWKLLVNNREAALNAGGARIAMLPLDDFIEIKGNDLQKNVEFQVQVSDPEKVASWDLMVTTVEGDAINRISGKGAPPSPVLWVIRNDRALLLKRGEIYQYRMVIEYTDGTSVTTPFRLFGINRSSSFFLSFIGDAFYKGSNLLSRKTKEILRQTAVLMREHKNEQLIVEGHIDAGDMAVYSQKLWKKRWYTVANYLIKRQKIPAERIMIRWCGETRPVKRSAEVRVPKLKRRGAVKGARDAGKAEVADLFRQGASVKIDGSPVATDDRGHFFHTVGQKSDSVGIEMATSDGRSLRTTLVLPSVTLAQPPAGGVRLPQNGISADKKPPLIEYVFVGKTMAGDLLTLNGRTVPVAQNGSFSFALKLAEGETMQWLQVCGQGGYCKRYKLSVSVAREPASLNPGNGTPAKEALSQNAKTR